MLFTSVLLIRTSLSPTLIPAFSAAEPGFTCWTITAAAARVRWQN